MNSTIDLIVSPWQKYCNVCIRDVILFNGYTHHSYKVWRNKGKPWCGIVGISKTANDTVMMFDKALAADIVMDAIDNYAKKHYSIVFLSQDKFDRILPLR